MPSIVQVQFALVMLSQVYFVLISYVKTYLFLNCYKLCSINIFSWVNRVKLLYDYRSLYMTDSPAFTFHVSAHWKHSLSWWVQALTLALAQAAEQVMKHEAVVMKQ